MPGVLELGDAARLAGRTVVTGAGVTATATQSVVVALRASAAPPVVAASSEAPRSAAFRAVIPVAGVMLGNARLRSLAMRRLARVRLEQRARPREHSWGHARVEWAGACGGVYIGDEAAARGESG